MKRDAKTACLLLVIMSAFAFSLVTAQEAELTGEIAYSSGGDIFTMDLASRSVQQLTQDGTSTYPRWSPDGETIAYVSDGDIHLMDADGSNQRNLTNHPSYDFLPVWSPDGKQIAFYLVEMRILHLIITI
jgi:dipeptidyl aminopeptidase/acylaminoacyl peptidase